MGSHPHIAAQILESGGNYILALKANQKETMRAVETRFAELDAAEGFDAATIAAGIVLGALLTPGPPRGGLSVAFSHGCFEQRL